MTQVRYTEIKRKLKAVFFVTLTLAFVIATFVGVWQLAIHYLTFTTHA